MNQVTLSYCDVGMGNLSWEHKAMLVRMSLLRQIIDYCRIFYEVIDSRVKSD